MNDKKNYEIVKHIAVLSYRGAWRKEVNLIKWFGNEAKYDIRDWNESHTEMSKGVTLTRSELQNLLITFFSSDETINHQQKNYSEVEIETEIDGILTKIFS